VDEFNCFPFGNSDFLATRYLKIPDQGMLTLEQLMVLVALPGSLNLPSFVKIHPLEVAQDIRDNAAYLCPAITLS
jgi:hypothetical protein